MYLLSIKPQLGANEKLRYPQIDRATLNLAGRGFWRVVRLGILWGGRSRILTVKRGADFGGIGHSLGSDRDVFGPGATIREIAGYSRCFDGGV